MVKPPLPSSVSTATILILCDLLMPALDGQTLYGLLQRQSLLLDSRVLRSRIVREAQLIFKAIEK